MPPHHELLSPGSHMPEGRFKCITVAIVTVSLTLGLLIPNIELVLGLVGSTIGILICVIIPAALFLSLTTKNNNERLLAQVLYLPISPTLLFIEHYKLSSVYPEFSKETIKMLIKNSKQVLKIALIIQRE